MFRLVRLLAAAVVVASVVATSAPAGEVAAGRYIVVLKDSVASPAAVAQEQARKYGITVELVYGSALKGYAGTIPQERIASLQADPRVRFVSEDGVVQADVQTLPTGVDRIDGELSATAKIDGLDERVDVDVAVIDTGIDSTHPDLNVAGGYNCTSSNTAAWRDGYGHGTHVAGTIGALDNDFGVVGVAPGARVWAIKVLGASGSGFRSWVICGIDYVTAHADVFEVANMSLSGSGSDDGNCGLTNDDPEHLAICNSVAAGVTYAVAAGNQATDAATRVPAAYDEVITVSALADFDGKPGGLGSPTCRDDIDDTLADFSDFGGDVDLIGPGVCILSTVPISGQVGSTTGYRLLSGTSMATPHVAGAAALYRSTHPTASPAQVQTALERLGSRNWNDVDDPDGIKEPLVFASRL